MVGYMTQFLRLKMVGSAYKVWGQVAGHSKAPRSGAFFLNSGELARNSCASKSQFGLMFPEPTSRLSPLCLCRFFGCDRGLKGHREFAPG